MKGQVGGFQNPGVCLAAFPSFPSPSLAFLCLAIIIITLFKCQSSSALALTNSTHIWRRVRESNPGHTGGRRAFSPLRHPCSPFFARVKHRKSRSSVFLCSPTPRKRLLRRIVLSCTDKRKFEVSGAGNVTRRMKSYFIRICICICIWQGCSAETELNP